MAGSLPQQVKEEVRRVGGMYHRLVRLVGPPGGGKTAVLRQLDVEEGWPRINVNRLLSERLLELTSKQRAVRLPAVLDDVAGDTPGDVLLLDNIEMLFHPDFGQDPLRLLQRLARNRTIVVAWPGEGDGQHLSYAVPDHREWKRYDTPDALIVRVTG